MLEKIFSYSLEEIANAIDGELINYTQNIKIHSITTDSRTLKPGDLFLALTGEKFNGHYFLDDATNLGAVAAIIDDARYINSKIPIILVKNTLEAYGKIANFHRQNLKSTKFIALTASVGKTTLKNLLAHCLEKYCPTFSSHANFNNAVGVPYNILKIDNLQKFAILELGMQWPGEISYLSKIVEPEIAIVGKVGAAHLVFFENLAGIAKGKSEIFDHLQKNGVAIINTDSEYFDLIYKKVPNGAKIITYGKKPCSDIKYISHTANNDNTCEVMIEIFGSKLKYLLPISIISLIENSLAVFALLTALNLDFAKAIDSFMHFEVPVGRGKIIHREIKGKKIIFINDAYNAGFDAMCASLQNLSSLKFNGVVKRRVAILGQMGELGRYASDFHKKLSQYCNNIDSIATIGGSAIKELNNLLEKEKNLGHYSNVDELLPIIPELLQDGDLVLVKGSFSNGMVRIIEQ